jgi:protein arginine N-methyltransferase 7
MGAKKVFVLEEHPHSARVMKELVRFNGLENVVTVIHKKPEEVTPADLNDLKVNIVLGDPYFHSSILPWNNLYFWYAKETLSWSLANDARIIPSKAYLKGIAVEFQDLHHIKAPVKVVKSCDDNNSGYDLQDFDNLVLRASDLTDHRIDAQPLWEYKGTGLSHEINLATIDLTQSQLVVSHEPVEYQKFHSPANSIALWMDWQLDEDTVVANGPIMPSPTPESAANKLTWDMNSKQGVFFTGRNDVLDTTNIDVKYNVNSGDVEIWAVTKIWDEDKKEWVVQRT